MKNFKIYPIGVVHHINSKSVLNIYEKYGEGLYGLKEGMNVIVILWFDRSDNQEKRNTLKVYPRGDKANPIQGVFSTRSPVRPNPLAIYNVKILKIDKNKIYIEKIDAYENTPIIDIKL